MSEAFYEDDQEAFLVHADGDGSDFEQRVCGAVETAGFHIHHHGR